MNKKLFITAVGMLLLASCSHEADLVQSKEAYEENKANENAENVLGFKLNPNQDWNMTVNGQVNITADASVKKVMVVVDVLDITDDSTPSYVTRNSMHMLNQAETNGRTNLTLHYDAPKENLGLYVAFITDESIYLSKVENGAASFTSEAKTRGTKLDNGYTLPDPEKFFVAGSEASWASMATLNGKEFQGWNPGEVFYVLNDYKSLKMTSGDYTQDFKDGFAKNVLTGLPNGRWQDDDKTIPNDNTVTPEGTVRVTNTDAYNNNCYVTTTGDEPVILTPMYKCDHPTQYGYEVWSSDLYYYYYDPAKVTGDFASYIKSLPKYKAIPFDQVFEKTEDAVISKHGSFALLYFNTGDDQTPASSNTPCSFYFPKGYKIGFMIKANTDYDHDDVRSDKKKGELYGDGRLNNNINKWGNFKSSGFTKKNNRTNFPRVYMLSYGGKKFMAWESGTDCDFNDVFIEIEGGKVNGDIIIPDPEVYTYCFEDTETGDYDLNDVVIKASRINETTVQYQIVACGAHDEVAVMGTGCTDLDGHEIHELFGVDPNTFINTDSYKNTNFPTSTKTVDKEFSFKNTDTHPYIKDLTTNKTVPMAKAGQGPHGIMIPGDFQYPREKVRIDQAYREFDTWGSDAVLSTEWYLSEKAVPGTVWVW